MAARRRTLYGSAEDLSARTPAELLYDAERQKPGHKKNGAPITDLRRLRRLTMLVEHGYYSRRQCTEEMLDEAVKLAAALLRPAPGVPTIVASPALSGERDIRAPGAPRPLG